MKCVGPAFCFLLLLVTVSNHPVKAQKYEIEQLLLNVEKLAQLKQILQDMYKGYKILNDGYTAIKDISQGNFSIHKVFLDKLLTVSPTVEKYRRIADIIKYQLRIINEYKAAYRHFKQDKHFTEKEIEYMGKVYTNLGDMSIKNLDDLITIITSGILRMSDDERISAIDKIFEEISEEYSFLQQFNNSAKLLSRARTREHADIDISRTIFGVR